MYTNPNRIHKKTNSSYVWWLTTEADVFTVIVQCMCEHRLDEILIAQAHIVCRVLDRYIVNIQTTTLGRSEETGQPQQQYIDTFYVHCSKMHGHMAFV